MVQELHPKTDFIPAEVFVVDDLDTLKVLADPLRLRIRELMEKPTTVKRVAERLDMLPTKLYYHINLLEKHGLIVLVDTRIVSGIIEKHYQVAAKIVKVAKHLLSTGDDPEGKGISLTIGSLFESTLEELLSSARSGMVEWDDEGERHKGLSFHMGALHLTDEQAAAFYQELESLLKSYRKISDDQRDESVEGLKAYRTLALLFPKNAQPDSDE